MEQNIIKRVLYLLLFSFLSVSNLFAGPAQLNKSHVKEVMNDMFVYHIEQKQMNPGIVKRSFKIYLDRFDALKYYLTQSEIKKFTNPSDQMLNDAVSKYHQGDLYYYQEMQALIETAILRARKNRELMRYEVEQAVISKSSQPKNYDPSLTYPKNNQDLVKRQKEHMERFVTVQERATPFVVTTKDYEKMFDYYECRMREYESVFFAESDAANSSALAEHNLAFHTLKALTRSLDTHTEYYSLEETKMMQTSLSRGHYGPGLVLQRDYRGVTVYEVAKDGPAAKTGAISTGDEVVSINNREVKKLKSQDIVELLHGGDDSKLKLVVRSADKNGNMKEKSVVVQREKVTLSNRLIEVSYEPYKEGIIGKITLNSFYDNQAGVSSSKDISKALTELKAKGELKGLVLDIRENTGGYLMQAVEVAGLFITNGVVAAAKFSDGKLHYLRDLDGKKQYDGPLVLLTSRLSASSSEIVAGTLKDYGVAVIVGDPQTFGKGSVQYQTLTMPNPKHYFKVTIGRYYTVSGKCTQLDGVKADIILPSHYYYEKIGEQYVPTPLGRDSIAPAFNDDLHDLDARAKDIFTRFYLPTLQKRTDEWTQMLPSLSKNSAARLARNRDFQNYMRCLESGQQPQTAIGKDIQMQEAVFIVQDMIEMRSKKPAKQMLFNR